jgi:hypothetical protein
MLRTSSIPTAMNAALISPAVARANVRLAAAGRPEEEDASARGLAVRLEEVGLRERMDDLHPNLVLDVLHAADVGEGNSRSLGRERLDVVLEIRVMCRDRHALGRLAGGERGGKFRVRERRIELDRACIALPRLLRLSLVQQDPRQQQLRGRLSILGQAFRENLRLPQPSKREERVGEPESGRVSRPVRQRLPELGLRFGGPAGGEQRGREMLAEWQVVRRDGKGIAKRIDRCVRIHGRSLAAGRRQLNAGPKFLTQC